MALVDATEASAEPLRKPKILIIEDNPTFREAMVEHFSECGFRVISAETHSAVIRDSFYSYKVIISDAETDNAAVHDSDGERFLRMCSEEVGKKTIAISSSQYANDAMCGIADARRKARTAVLKPEYSSDKDQMDRFLSELEDAAKEIITAQEQKSVRANAR